MSLCQKHGLPRRRCLREDSASGQAPAVAERSVPPPPLKPDQPPRAPNDAGEQSRQLSANQNTPPPAARVPRCTAPGGFNFTGNQLSRPAQPSTQFLAQQIAQETAPPQRPSANFAAAANAYGRSRGNIPRAAGEPLIVTRSIDRSV